MVLHLGGDVVIPMKDVIGIFDLETSEDSQTNKEFLEIVKEEGFVRVLSEDAPKTFVLTECNNKIKIYLSPISSSTLKKEPDLYRTYLSKAIRTRGYDGE